MKSSISTVLWAAASLLLADSAFAQNVNFMSTPVANSCAHPNVITMTPAPAVWIAPNASRVMTKVVNNFQTPLGNFVAVGNHAINPGNLCYFHLCGPAHIVLTCAPIGANSDQNEEIMLKKVGEAKTQ